MSVRYGMISVASITDRFMHAVLENGDVITAVASRSLTKAKQKADQYGIKRAYSSYEDVYRDNDVDIVYIAVNNANHSREVKRALQHGKHVLCEKPIALCAEDAEELFTYARKQGLFLMEAQKSLFLPVTQVVRTHIQKQTLGRLHQIEMSASFPNPAAAWMHDPAQGGVVYGSASYTIEYLDYLLAPKQIHTSTMGTKEAGGACDRISMNFLFDDILVNSRISMNGPTQHHAIFYFEKGYIHVPDFWKAREYTLVKGKDHQCFTFPCQYEMKYEAAHVRECLKNGWQESPIMPANRSIRCCSIVDDIMQQLEQVNREEGR